MTILRSGVSAMVWSAKPTTEYGSPAKLNLKTAAGYAFLQVGLPSDLHKGATVLTAKLRVQQWGAWSGRP